MHSFCAELDKLLKHPDYKTAKIYHYCSEDYRKKANAAFLMGAYQVTYLRRTSKEAWKLFEKESFKDFRDAMRGTCTYKCTIQHCLEALEWAQKLGWYNPATFNVAEYQYYESVDNGDMNWIIPGKFLAFSTPVDPTKGSDGYSFSPEYYVPIFKKMGITSVIRLNTKEYDRERFIKKGIKHYDLYFPDGSCPSEEKVKEFLDITEKEPAAFAVHCKAGLGRTGTLISCYAIKNYKIPATAMIAWIRICRPGSVLGPQQHFLTQNEGTLLAAPSKFAGSVTDITKKIKKMGLADNGTAMTEKEKEIAVNGDLGQASGLLDKKKGYKKSG